MVFHFNGLLKKNKKKTIVYFRTSPPRALTLSSLLIRGGQVGWMDCWSFRKKGGTDSDQTRIRKTKTTKHWDLGMQMKLILKFESCFTPSFSQLSEISTHLIWFLQDRIQCIQALVIHFVGNGLVTHAHGRWE